MDRRLFVAPGLAATLAATLGLGGCGRFNSAAAPSDEGHGRYAGVGLYSPTKQWTEVVTEDQPQDPQRAKPIDDQVIIVVQDTVTGEVRACGDLTGRCIGLNPWKEALASSPGCAKTLRRNGCAAAIR